MTKMDLLRLWKMGLGGVLIINGRRHKISEVVKYEEKGEEWLNLVWKQGGMEFALEVENKKLTLWKEVDDILPSDSFPISLPEIEYRGEKYKEAEFGTAKAVSETRTGKKESMVMWRVLEAKSGHKLAVEGWDDGVYFYYAEGTLPVSTVQAI